MSLIEGARADDLYRGVKPRTVRSHASWVIVTWDPPVNRQTDMTENITLVGSNKIHFFAVKIMGSMAVWLCHGLQ